MGNAITLTKIYNPMNRADQDTITWEHRPGLTVADLLDNVGARLGLAQRDSLQLAVSVDGRTVPAEQYTTTTLLTGQHVTLVPVLTGGGGGKDVLRMVGAVIIAIVAYYYMGPLAGNFLGELTGYTAAGYYAGFAIGVAGTMLAGTALINAVLPPEVF